MDRLRQETIDTYNHSAAELAGSPQDARVVEIGCGDGRDAKEIVGRVGSYTGFDISDELIKLARQQVPGAKFEVADLADFQFPEDLDVVYAFASLLHSGQTEVRGVLARVHEALKPRGIAFISLKYRSDYGEEVQEDRFGTRLFYYYSPELIEQLAGPGFETAYLDQKVIGSTDWFEMALRKI